MKSIIDMPRYGISRLINNHFILRYLQYWNLYDIQYSYGFNL